jgi:putative Mn2+ efflux pump MntP
MNFFEILLLSVALAMDASAVGMTDGMTNPHMPFKKQALIGGLFGFFQFLMPLIGYFLCKIIAEAFFDTFQSISAWVSFALLLVLGGKMIFEAIKEMRAKRLGEITQTACELCLPKLLTQAVATSIDALAVGVTLQMASLSQKGLALGAWGATLTIGIVTFILSFLAVGLGKKIGDKLADKADLFGGIVLIAIGLKILIESFL